MKGLLRHYRFILDVSELAVHPTCIYLDCLESADYHDSCILLSLQVVRSLSRQHRIVCHVRSKVLENTLQTQVYCRLIGAPSWPHQTLLYTVEYTVDALTQHRAHLETLNMGPIAVRPPRSVLSRFGSKSPLPQGLTKSDHYHFSSAAKKALIPADLWHHSSLARPAKGQSRLHCCAIT